MGKDTRAEGKASILIVDDHRDNLLAIDSALEPLGQNVVRAQSGKEALRLLLRQDFALIMLDVAMPEMDGFETAKVIRESHRHRHTPIVFLTGKRSAENIKRGYALGAADYIEKPVEPETLRSKVAALIHLFREVGAWPDEPRVNILVADDTPANLTAIEGALSSLRENIVTARSGEEALRLLEEQEFAVLLLDVKLPGIDGFETATAIRNNPRTRELPIILMSAVAQAAENLARGYGVGAVDYLFSPAEPAVLRAKVAVFVDLLKKREWLRRHEEQIRLLEHTESAKRIAEERLRTIQERQAREIEALKTRAAEELAATRAASIAELGQKNAELAALNQELEAFSYSVSHDLRAPLRSIDGFSQALLQDYADRLDEAGQKHLGRVRESAQHMAELIDGLLALARVTRSELRRERVDLSRLARGIAGRLQDRSAESGRRVDFVVQDGVSAEGDARLLAIVIENLLGNAWKFTSKHPQGRIEFGLSVQEGRPAFFVRDDGAGFDMAYAGKLFGAFQRLHAASEFEGHGIGLATVQRIVRRHGGRIWGEGRVGAGATFYFTLGEGNQSG